MMKFQKLFSSDLLFASHANNFLLIYSPAHTKAKGGEVNEEGVVQYSSVQATDSREQVQMSNIGCYPYEDEY